MPEISDAQSLLAALGMPPAQHNEMAALTLLALCSLKPHDEWQSAQRHSTTISNGIMAFIREHYGRHYAPNTRETFRRQVLHQLVQARLVDYNPDNPALPTNSPKVHYALNESALVAIRAYGTEAWGQVLADFTRQHRSETPHAATARQTAEVALTLPDGSAIRLSPGQHNQLQAQVIEHFVPQFASGAMLLYLGDTADKDLYVASEYLTRLAIPVSEHAKLPDIILYLEARNWLYLIEVVTSHGPMTPKRIHELHDMLRDCPAGKVFVTAFPTFAEFRKHMRHIAWETEVWIAEAPEHLIHFNGDRFLGPRP